MELKNKYNRVADDRQQLQEFTNKVCDSLDNGKDNFINLSTSLKLNPQSISTINLQELINNEEIEFNTCFKIENKGFVYTRSSKKPTTQKTYYGLNSGDIVIYTQVKRGLPPASHSTIYFLYKAHPEELVITPDMLDFDEISEGNIPYCINIRTEGFANKYIKYVKYKDGEKYLLNGIDMFIDTQSSNDIDCSFHKQAIGINNWPLSDDTFFPYMDIGNWGAGEFNNLVTLFIQTPLDSSYQFPFEFTEDVELNATLLNEYFTFLLGVCIGFLHYEV